MAASKTHKKPRRPPITFAADAALIDRLGRELVAKQETALVELVKNSFDADATEVDVVLEGRGNSSALEIRDNGSGMARAQIVNGFLRLASDLKVQEPRSPVYKRQRAGRKGIGRFAAQRLGAKLILTTCVDGATHGHELVVNWDLFVAGKDLQEVGVDLKKVPPTKRGTTIRIENLRDPWTDAELRKCFMAVLALQQPFPVAPIKRRPTVDPGFTVRFFRKSQQFEDETVVADLQTEILDHLHAVIELKVDGRGRAFWRLAKNRLGETRDWTAIHHAQRDPGAPPAYGHLRNVWMKAHYAILQPTLLPRVVFARVRDVLAEQGGIRLYRNGFRVIPYGDPGNDWLRLDEMYAKRSLLVPAANRNFFGVIEVNDPEGKNFEEHTSREGLIETPAFLELRDLASSVLITAVTRISEDRGRKTHAGGRTRRPDFGEPTTSESGSPTDAAAVDAAVRAAQEAAETASREGDAASAKEAASKAAEAARLLTAARVQLADEASILRFLATLGMTTAEFSHETGMTFDAFRLDFERVFEAARTARPDDERLIVQAARAKGMLARLDTLTSYLNALAGARAARGMRPISVSKAVQEFERGMRAQAESQHISLKVRTPAYDPLFTRPMHEAEIASVLLNFYTNAVKALKRGYGSRQIFVEADRVVEPAGEMIRIRFADTGDGVPDDIRDRIFDAFFTTRIAPPAGAPETEHATGAGLGLWIVKQIATNAGGSVGLTAPPHGYSTCFELMLPSEEGAELR